MKKKKEGEKGKNSKDNSKGKNIGKKKSREKWAWKQAPPKPLTKIFEGKTYYWCPIHNVWTLHKPNKCKEKAKHEPEGTAATMMPTSPSSSNKSLL